MNDNAILFLDVLFLFIHAINSEFFAYKQLRLQSKEKTMASTLDSYDLKLLAAIQQDARRKTNWAKR